MKDRWLLVLCVLGFTILVAYRAVHIPMTHDEASTWLNYRYHNLWNCVTDYRCWQTANNHWLNSLLLQCSAGLFGEGVLALRLPNVIAGSLYFFAAALFSWRFIHPERLQVLGFLLLCGHAYLLDFFSLARGYGLMTCGVIWSVYFLLRYIEHYKLQWLVFSILSMVLAVLSNFTALLPLASLGLGWLVLVLWQRKFQLLFRHGYVWVIAGIILGGLLYFPIRMLRASGEFEWGAAGLSETLKNLTTNLLYGAHYFGDKSPVVLLWILFGVLFLVTVAALISSQNNSRMQMMGVLLLLILNLSGIAFLASFMDAQTPVGRKSIYLIPFLFAPISLGLNLVKNKYAVPILGVLLPFLLLFHSFRQASPVMCREWYYDAYYPGLFSAILPIVPAGDSIRLGSSWIFNPALSYYQKAKSLPLSGLAYQKPLVIDPVMEFYFVEYSDTVGMTGAGFYLEKTIGPFFLFKNSAAARSSIPIN